MDRRSLKNQGFNGIRTRDLRVAGALLYQLSYEAKHWEQGLNSHVHLRNEGGARICGEVVLVNFWCHVQETLISIFSIAVSQNQAVCGLFNYFWLISIQFQFSYNYYFAWCLYVYLCRFAVLPSPKLCPLQRRLTAHRIPLNI